MLNTATTNPISADTTGIMQYSLGDSTCAPILVDANTFRFVPGTDIDYTLDLRRSLKRNTDSTVNVVRYSLNNAWDDSNNRISFGILDNATGTTATGWPINALILDAQLSDSFPNPIRIRITVHNFNENPGQAVILDSLDLTMNSLANSLTIDLRGDSLIGGSLSREIDSLRFGIEVVVLGKLSVAPARLNHILTTALRIGQLHMDSFYGRVFAKGEAPSGLIANSLTGASAIAFDSARAELKVNASGGGFDSVYVCLSGRKVHGNSTMSDTSLSIANAEFVFDIGQTLSNLPDTIRVFVKAMSLPGTFHQGSVFPAGVDIRYNISAPLKFIIPATLTAASAKTTTYFIRDSTTRANIISAQQGADLDMTVENRTQLQGFLYFLISNFNFFPFDSLSDNLPAGFVSFNDTIWHLGDDTTFVTIDTLAALEFPAAQFSGNTLIAPGIKNQTFQTGYEAISLLADTCYFKPYFELINPDTSQTTITATQSIQVRGYLNLFFDAAVLNDSE